MMNRNEIKGKVDQVKGKAKMAMATVTGNRALKTQGKVDFAVGKARADVGTATRRADAVVARVAKAVRK